MELEFDKQIDALLKNTPDRRGVFRSSEEIHLDADEIAAFAENGVPDVAKQRLIFHFADCEACRATLSRLIRLRGEADALQVAAPAILKASESIVDAAPSLPWHSRLFGSAKLAYVLGGLVLVFAGFLGFSLLNRTNNSVSDVSKLENIAVATPVAEIQSDASSNSNAVSSMANSNSSSNAMTESLTNSSTAAAPQIGNVNDPRQTASAPAETKSKDVSLNDELEPRKSIGELHRGQTENAAGQDMPAAAPPPAPIPNRESPAAADTARSTPKPNAYATSNRAATPNASRNESASSQEKLRAEKKAAESDPVMKKRSASELRSTGRRVIGGKTFDLKPGVWYDAAYQGQQTQNVRRGTDQYKKLDRELRAIAESFSGTVVVMWKGKAYRFD